MYFVHLACDVAALLCASLLFVYVCRVVLLLRFVQYLLSFPPPFSSFPSFLPYPPLSCIDDGCRTRAEVIWGLRGRVIEHQYLWTHRDRPHNGGWSRLG